MEVQGDTLIIDIEYDTEELLQPILHKMKSRSWYRRLIDARFKVGLNFLAALAVLFWLDLVSVRSVLLAAVAAIVVSGIVPTVLLEGLAEFGKLLEHKYRERFADTQKPSYRFTLSPAGIRREYQQNVALWAWPDVESAIETEQGILLSHYDPTGYLFPK